MTEVTLSTLLTDVGSILTAAVGWVGSVITTIVGQPLLLLFVLMGFVGYGVHLYRMMRGQRIRAPEYTAPFRLGVLMILLILLLAFFLIKIYFMFPVRTFYKLRSDHLSVFYGAPGSGKSTLAAFYAQKALKAGYRVYSNFPIKGCYAYEKSDLGKYAMTNCLIIVDEAGIDWNNRDFAYNFSKKSGGSKALEFFKKHRHEKAEIMCFSQTFDDMDKKIFK